MYQYLTKYRNHKVFQSKQINIILFTWQKNINVCNTKMNEKYMDVTESNFHLEDVLSLTPMKCHRLSESYAT